MSYFREIAKRHVSKTDTREYENFTPRPPSRYEVYECDHCGQEFTIQAGQRRSNLDSWIHDHLEDEHPEELERDPYPNEGVFQEWADAIGAKVEEPRMPGDSLMVRWSEMAYVYLENDGTIHLEANRVLGGDREDEVVRLEGEDRLAVRGRAHRNGYVSRDAFPVMRR